MRAQIKEFIDANCWDGDDRSGCPADWIKFDPDELQTLVEDCIGHVLQQTVEKFIEECEKVGDTP